MRLKDKVALITGASRGIGRAIAEAYAAEGAKVAVNYARNQQQAEEAVQTIEASGGQAISVRADCSSISQLNEMVDAVVVDYGRLDILVNNAGVFRPVSIDETSESVWDEQLDLNLKGAFFAVKAVLPIFRSQGGGKVVNITSIAGVKGFPNSTAYCASKGGLENLTRALASDLAIENINVNAIAPGNIATDINEHLRVDSSFVEELKTKTPNGQAYLNVNDLVGAAVLLASAESNAMHGSTIVVDGGWCAA